MKTPLTTGALVQTTSHPPSVASEASGGLLFPCFDRLFSSTHARNVGVVNQCRDGKTESVKVLVAQSSPTLCDLMDRSPPGSSVHGTFQARILEWVAIFSSRDRTQISCIGRQTLYRLSHQGSIYVGAKEE